MTPIMGDSIASIEQMKKQLQNHNDQLDAMLYASYYLNEGKKEGVRGDIAFAQSCVETGYWKFGGDVKASQNNFAGLGATGNGNAGLSFGTPELGIRAQIQHLKAYASTDDLNEECIDPRFKYVSRGCVPFVEYLGIQENPNHIGWAAGANYGSKILTILNEILKIEVESNNEDESDDKKDTVDSSETESETKNKESSTESSSCNNDEPVSSSSTGDSVTNSEVEKTDTEKEKVTEAQVYAKTNIIAKIVECVLNVFQMILTFIKNNKSSSK